MVLDVLLIVPAMAMEPGHKRFAGKGGRHVGQGFSK